MLYFISFFFFQAEDGIRDLVRSRGLGDVYKRQAVALAFGESTNTAIFIGAALTATSVGITARVFGDLHALATTEAVSYTHLTLPTSDLV